MAMFTLNEQNRKWWTLFAMVSSSAMIFLDITILPVALPTIQKTLGLSELGLQWIINAYTLSLAVFLLAAGRFGDAYSHRRIFCIGLAVFSTGSILCGLSPFQSWFICARALQGIGGAMLSPNASTLVFNSFPPNQRGMAVGIFISTSSVFLAFGPFIGGIFSQYLSWRFIFWINIPIALMGYLLTRFAVLKKEGRSLHFDWGGFLTTSLGICSIVIALMQSKSWGWLSPATIFLFVLGLFCLITLLRIDRQVKDPYFDFSLFKKKTFTGSCLSITIVQFVLMLTVFWVVYFQKIFGFSPSTAGTLSLISNSPIILMAPLGGHLLDKKGPLFPIFMGFILMIVSLGWFIVNIDNPRPLIILSAIVPFGCSIPLILTPSFTTAMSQAPPLRRGLASGTISTLRQLGGTLGIAVLSSFFLTTQIGQFREDLSSNPLTAHQEPLQFEGLLAKVPKAVDALKSLPKEAQSFIETSYRSSYMRGFLSVNIVSFFMAVAGLFFALFLIKKRNQPQF